MIGVLSGRNRSEPKMVAISPKVAIPSENA